MSLNVKFSNQVWAIIPARSGSKRLKNKNILKVGKISLVGHAIKIAKNTKSINRVFVSTDSKKIKKESIKHNAEIPFLRSKLNSQDFSTDFDVLNEFLKKIYKFEKILPKYIIFLRPTTPIRNEKVISRAIAKFKKLKNYDSLVSVHKMDEPVHKKFFIKKNQLKTIFSKISIDNANEPRQGFQPSYTANGYLDIIKTENIFKNKYLGRKCFPYIVKKSIDIDDKIDLIFANFLISKKKNV